ncbi:DUF1385 domain-containing protein [Pseudalkalibacillus berkeleyi]|uniref:DUF1385 domain-containing protein n=1 Tax=Pseudalkalibacillus berkeleyi TaxID=1069813 RepID=A0ABS9H2M5_9BACL|nr:DUF1385 domain-containing protein [Pseudalkalibacillus berkeleyi]MCF6139204.1 DUF1385 domain-containing protein [Pseudalkalibacillus berkeleyi]
MGRIHGGMAGINSVMYYGNDKKVKAKRGQDGQIVVKEQRLVPNRFLKIKQKLEKIPFVRGAWMIMKTMLMTWKVYLGVLMVFLLQKMSGDLVSSSKAEGLFTNGLAVFPEQTHHIVTFGSFMLLFAMLVKFTSLGKYHGAEHMVDNAYSQTKDLSIENVMNFSRIHNKCGTNLVVFIFMFYSVLYLMMNSILAILLAFVLGYEVFILRNKKVNHLLKPIYKLGHAAQYALFTAQPDKEHVEVAVAAYDGIVLEK